MVKIIRVQIRPHLSSNRRIVRNVFPSPNTHSLISSIDWQESIRIFGNGVTLFVGFYCGLQWLHYKKIREHMEQQNKEKDKK